MPGAVEVCSEVLILAMTSRAGFTAHRLFELLHHRRRKDLSQRRGYRLAQCPFRIVLHPLPQGFAPLRRQVSTRSNQGRTIRRIRRQIPFYPTIEFPDRPVLCLARQRGVRVVRLSPSARSLGDRCRHSAGTPLRRSDRQPMPANLYAAVATVLNRSFVHD